MKIQKILVVALSALALQVSAQITINSGDLVNLGDRVFNSVDQSSGVNIGPSGANQTWNFSGLATSVVDTLDFTNPSWVGLSNPFNAQMVVTSTYDDSTFTFLTKTSSALIMNGVFVLLQNGDTGKIPLNTVFIPFPATYGMSGSSSGNTKIASIAVGIDPDGPGPHPTVDSMMVTHAFTGTQSADAWGNITTPLGTFPSLRQNSIQYAIDTTWMFTNGSWKVISPTVSNVFNQDSITHDTTATVRWWTNDPSAKYPVVEFDYDINSGNNVSYVKWLKTSPTASVKEHKQDFTVTVSPNPTNDGNITVFAQQTIKSISVIDITGKVIYNDAVRNGKTNVHLSLTLPTGVYFVKITNNEQQTTVKRMIIN